MTKINWDRCKRNGVAYAGNQKGIRKKKVGNWIKSQIAKKLEIDYEILNDLIALLSIKPTKIIRSSSGFNIPVYSDGQFGEIKKELFKLREENDRKEKLILKRSASDGKAEGRERRVPVK